MANVLGWTEIGPTVPSKITSNTLFIDAAKFLLFHVLNPTSHTELCVCDH